MPKGKKKKPVPSSTYDSTTSSTSSTSSSSTSSSSASSSSSDSSSTKVVQKKEKAKKNKVKKKVTKEKTTDEKVGKKKSLRKKNSGKKSVKRSKTPISPSVSHPRNKSKLKELESSQIPSTTSENSNNVSLYVLFRTSISSETLLPKEYNKSTFCYLNTHNKKLFSRAYVEVWFPEFGKVANISYTVEVWLS